MSLCARSRRDLPLFVGGDLESGRAAEVSRHLRACPACRSEAVRLQQPLRHLQRLAAAIDDEAGFASLQATIIDRIGREQENGGPALRGPFGQRLWWTAAAVAVVVSFAIGWWSVRAVAAPAALERAPIAIPVGHPGPALVVPYAGPRVPVRLLGDEPAAGRGPGSGMLGRWRLHALVDEALADPVSPAPK
jgi:anti-sigma factor RsiW